MCTFWLLLVLPVSDKEISPPKLRHSSVRGPASMEANAVPPPTPLPILMRSLISPNASGSTRARLVRSTYSRRPRILAISFRVMPQSRQHATYAAVMPCRHSASREHRAPDGAARLKFVAIATVGGLSVASQSVHFVARWHPQARVRITERERAAWTVLCPSPPGLWACNRCLESHPAGGQKQLQST